MESKKIHECVRDYISEAGISQKLIAQNANMSEGKLSLVLSGKRKMTVNDYLDICKAIAVPPTKFLQ